MSETQAPQAPQGNSNGFQKKPYSGPRYANPFLETKTRLYAEKQPNVEYIDGVPSFVSMKMVFSNPRLVVKTNIKNEKEEITCKMDPIIVQMFFDVVEEAADAAPGFRVGMVFKDKNKETNKIYDESRIIVGKQSENGLVYLEIASMEEGSRLKVVFNFGKKGYLSMLNGDGTDMSMANSSKSYAKAWVRHMRELVHHSMTTIPAKKPMGEFQAQGNRPTGGYQKPAYQKPAYTPQPQNPYIQKEARPEYSMDDDIA